MDNLLKGTRYENLPESYIIFICTKDPFEHNLAVYDVKKIFKNSEIEYNDCVHTIFFNAACYEKVENPTLRSFLQYVHNRKIENDFTSKIDEAAEFAKHNARWRVEYMFLHDILDEEKVKARTEGLAEGRAEGLAEGREKGLAEGRAEGIAQGSHDASAQAARNMLEAGLPIEQICKFVNLPPEEVKALQK